MAKNESDTYVHVHAFGESDDPVTGRTVRTPIGTVVVAPGEEFPEWAEAGQDYDESLTERPDRDEQDDVAAGVGVFPFDLDRAVTIRREQEAGDRERVQRQERAEEINRLMQEQRSRDSSPEKAKASGAANKSGGGTR